MEIQNGLKVVVTGILYGEYGNIKQKFVKHNLIVNAGFDFLCGAFGNTTRPSAMTYLAVGTGTTAASATQTALVSELVRQSATYSHTSATKFLTLTTNYIAGTATGALTEAGIFNASSGGTLFDRVVFPVINKASTDTFTLTFTITFAET